MTQARSMVLLVALGAWTVGLGPDPALGQPRTQPTTGTSLQRTAPVRDTLKDTPHILPPGLCPTGYTKQVDKGYAFGTGADVCYKEVPLGATQAVPAGTPNTNPTAALQCPAGSQKLTNGGGCFFAQQPTCLGGRRLKVQQGEDVCE